MSGNRLNLVVNFAEAGLNKLQGGLKNLVGLGKNGSRAFRDMAREGRALERELAGVRRELDGASGNITELIGRERELERQLEATNRELVRQGALAKIDAGADAIRQRGEALRARGRDNITGGAAMLAPFLLAGHAAAQFSSGMVDIQQKMELSDAAAQSLAGRITLMASAAKQMPEDMRSGVDMLAGLGGLSLRQIEDAMGPAGRLATAYRVELPDAARAAHSSITNLQIPARATARIFDTMAAAGNEGGFEIRDMARHFPSLTARMAALGEKGVPAVADLSAALQVAMRTAGSADEAGNNIQNLLAKINAPGTIKKFEDNFGINLPAAMKRLTDEGYSALEAIAMITDRATGGDAAKLGFAFEDQQAQMGILALIQNMEEFRRIRGAAMGGNGIVDAAFDQRVANDQTVQLRELGGAMANLVLSVGPVLLPFLREMTSMLSTGAQAVANWAQGNPRAAGMLLKLVAGLAVGRIALGGLQMAFGGLLGPMSTAYRYFARVDGISRFGGHLKTMKDVAGKAAPVLVRAFTMMRTGAMFLARGLMQAGLMMMANPIILVIAAVVLAVGVAAYLIYTHWDTIKGAFWQGVAAVGNAMSWVWSKLVAAFNLWRSLHAQAIDIGKNIILGLANGILAAPGAVWNALKTVVIGGVDRIKSFLGINSPSRLFMDFGGHMAQGMAIGLDRKRQDAFASARRLATGVAGAAALATGAPIAASPAVGARPAAAPPVYNISVRAAPGQSAEEIARAVARELDRREREAAARSRSAFGDS